MGIKRRKPEEIVSKPRQVDVLVEQGMSCPDAIRQVSITEQTDQPHLIGPVAMLVRDENSWPQEGKELMYS